MTGRVGRDSGFPAGAAMRAFGTPQGRRRASSATLLAAPAGGPGLRHIARAVNTRTTLTLMLAMFGAMLVGLLWSQAVPAYRAHVEASEQIVVDVVRNDLLVALLGLQVDRGRIAATGSGPWADGDSGEILDVPIRALERASGNLGELGHQDWRALANEIAGAADALRIGAEALSAAERSGYPRAIAAERAGVIDAIDRAEERLRDMRSILLSESNLADPDLVGLQLIGNSVLEANDAIQRNRALLLRLLDSGEPVRTKDLRAAEERTTAFRGSVDVLQGTINLFDGHAATEAAILFEFFQWTYAPAEARLLKSMATGTEVEASRRIWMDAVAEFDGLVDDLRRFVFERSQAHHARKESAALVRMDTKIALSAAVFALFSLSLLAIERLILRPIERITDRMHELVAGDLAPGPSERFTLADMRSMADALRVFRVDAVRRNRLTRERLSLHAKIADAHNELKADLRAAAKVQLAQMPEPGDVGAVRFSTYFAAANVLAGDTFDFLPLSGDRVGLFQIDVAGHGAAAGLVSVAAHIAARRALRKLGPGESLVRAVTALNANWSPDLTYFTMATIELDTQANRGRMVQAGHPHPVLLRGDGSISRLGGGGLPIGAVPDADFEEIDFPFGTGDRLLVFSDGIYESINAQGEIFTEERFIDLLAGNAHRSTENLIESIRTALETWCCTGSLSDDVSLVVAERT